jgi:cold shock CspA family protein
VVHATAVIPQEEQRVAFEIVQERPEARNVRLIE